MENSEERRTASPNIEGFTKKNYVEDPELLGPVPAGIPKAVQSYLKVNSVSLLKDPNITYITRLYRISYEQGEQKEHKQYLQKFKNHIPDEDLIADTHGVGRYRWICCWDGPKGETGLISEPIEIGEGYVTEKGRTVIAGGPSRGSGAGSPVLPTTFYPPPQQDPLDMLEKLARISTIMAGNRPVPVSNELPTSILEKMALSQMSFMEKTNQRFQDRMDEVFKERRNELKLLAAPQEKDSEDMEPQQAPSTAMPEWVQTAMTMFDKYLPQLLGGGFAGEAVKVGIQQTELYKELFHDELKTTQLAQAMVHQFGEEKTRAVFEILAKVDAPPAPPAPVASNSTVTETKPAKEKPKK